MFYNGTCFFILITLISNSIQSVASSLQVKPVQQGINEDLYDFENRNYDEIYSINEKGLNRNDYDQIPNVNKRLSAQKNVNQDTNRQHITISNKFSLLGEKSHDLSEENVDDKITDYENNNYLSQRFSTNEKLNDALNKNYFNEIDLFDNHYASFHNYINLDGDYEAQNYDNKIMSLLAPKTKHTNALIYRREVPANGDNNINLENSSLYPSVLAKALQISLNPTAPTNTGEGILANVAQKLNTSTLDLAKKLTKSQTGHNNDQFAQIVQSYSTNSAKSSSLNSLNRPLIRTSENRSENLLIPEQNSKNNQEYLKNEEHFEDITSASLRAILDRVLNKLESLHDGKNKDYEDHPDGAPCDIVGSWSSTTLGLCFDIQLQKDKFRDISPAEINNKILSIGVVECTPAKHHQIIDLHWKFTGSAQKQWGGLFYLYGQKRIESVAATFLGFCRTCGGIDTIFGSWNFLSPSKDCNDISLAFEVKRDVLKRVRMEMKRKERFKDLLYQSRHGKT